MKRAVAAVVGTAIAASVLSSSAENAGAIGQSAEKVSSKQRLSVSVVYRCSDVAFDNTVGGPKNMRFTFIGSFPRKVAPGGRIKPKRMRVRTTVFRPFSRKLKTDLYVKKVRVKPRGLKIIAHNKGRRWATPEHHASSKWKRVRSRRSIRLRSNGRLAVPVRAKNGQVRLHIPVKFGLRLSFRPPAASFMPNVGLTCRARKGVDAKDRLIGVVRVR